MTYIVKVSTPAGPVLHIARGEEELDAVYERVLADGPVATVLTVMR